MLVVDDIHVFYAASHVLQGISLNVAPGEIVAIIGRNGAGKTTLIRSIVGLTPISRGSIRLREVEISAMSPYEISRMGVGLIPQGRRVFPSLTTLEHLELSHRPRAAAYWSVEGILSLFPQLKGLQRSRAGALSGGEQQMLAAGRALVANPDLILMDEPTEGLAPIRVRELADLLRLLRGQGAAILLVEQNLTFALRVADVIHVVDKGTIVHVATPAELRAGQTAIHDYLHLR